MEYNILNPYVKEEFKNLMKESIQECLNLNNQEQKTTSDELISQSKAAAFLQISVTTLIKRKKLGLIPFYQTSKHAPVYYKKSDLENMFYNK